MRLTWRDGVTTILAAVTVLIMFAVTQAWNWPLLQTYRSGIVALTIVGLASGCGSGVPLVADVRTWSFRDPFIWVGSLLGALAFALIVVGLIADSPVFFVALGLDLIALWVVATSRHLLEGGEPVRQPVRQA